MLGINLLHGWLYDPQDRETAAIIKDLSYNQVMRSLHAFIQKTVCLWSESGDAAHHSACRCGHGRPVCIAQQPPAFAEHSTIGA